jgi:hypothetical protein
MIDRKKSGINGLTFKQIFPFWRDKDFYISAQEADIKGLMPKGPKIVVVTSFASTVQKSMAVLTSAN